MKIKHWLLSTAFLATNALAAEVVPFDGVHSTKTVGSSFKIVKTVSLKNGMHVFKHQQYFQGIPVYGFFGTESIDASRNHRFTGTTLIRINEDIKNTNVTLSKDNALARLKKHAGIKNKVVENIRSTLFVYLMPNQHATMAYKVSFFVEGKQPKRPMAFIDANTGAIIYFWNGLATKEATGPGGNEKTGQYEYGNQFNYLNVTDDCQMSSTNVDTIDLNHQASGNTIFTITPCTEHPNNTYKAINGAYSPLNDAHGFGEVVFNLYKDWYNTAPLSFKLKMKVHYMNNFENAFWNGREMTFGDGKAKFYPLVGLDIVSHEVSHGFTEQNSDLIYANQSGGINEAFSDIAGEAAEYYINKYPNGNDWLVGAGIFKGPIGTALRYFEDPTADGISISHADNYWKGMDVHYSSGIFNHAFYLLAHKENWNVHKAFDVFVLANQMYWKPSATFDSAACGLKQAAIDLGYSTKDIISAFEEVGVNATCEEKPNATEIFSGEVISDIKGKKSSRHDYVITVPSHKHTLTIKAYGATGDADLYVKKDMGPDLESFDCRSYKKGRTKSSCVFLEPKPGKYYIMLHGYKKYKNLTLNAVID